MPRQAVQDVGQRHVAVRVVVAVGFAVGRDVHELRVLAGVVEAVEQAVQEPFAAVQEPLEGDLPRDGVWNGISITTCRAIRTTQA